MTTKKRFSLRVLGAAVLTAVGMGAAAAAEDVYREYYPRIAVDPAKGVRGDEEVSNTYQYWKDEKALEKHSNWIGDPENEWKLNAKWMDLDRFTIHSGYNYMEEGEALVKKWTKREPEFLTCLGEGKTDLKGLAANYPKYDAKLDKIMTVESRIERCAETVLWENIKQGSPDNNKMSMYFKSKSTGMPINVDLTSKPIMEAYKRGEQIYHMKSGQLNLSCAGCHLPSGLLGYKLRGQVSKSPFGLASPFPLYRNARGDIESIQQRFMFCSKLMRSMGEPPGNPTYIDLEVLMTVWSNGYPIAVPSQR